MINATAYRGRRVLVTGADGFIGSHLAEALSALGAEVTALALYNSFDSHGWLDELPIQVRRRLSLIRGDIRDGAFVHRIVNENDIIFHLAALIAIPQSYAITHSYVETNIVGTLNILEAARAHDPVRVVHTSTSEVYGTAMRMPICEKHLLQGQSPYSASKISADMMAEAFARSFAVRVAILRPFNTFGPRQSERAILPTLIRQALDDRCPSVKVGDTDIIRDMTFVSDTVRAFLALGASPDVKFGQPYNAGSGRATKVSELLTRVLDLTECRKPVETERSRFRPANSEVRALLADSSRLHAATAWRPQVELDEGIKRTIDWWRGRLAAGLVRPEASYMT